MKPKILSIRWAERPDLELEDLSLEDVLESGKGKLLPLQLELRIAYRPDRDSDLFYLLIACPEALKGNDRFRGFKPHKYTLVLSTYDWTELRDLLEQKVSNCENEDWQCSLDLLKGHFAWEFDEESWDPASREWLRDQLGS